MIYPLLLHAHSYNRWLVLVAAIATLWVSYRGWLGACRYGRLERMGGRTFLIALDVQALLGLALYALSPIVRTGLGDLGAAMGTKELRFFAIEHVAGMAIAIALAHAGAALVKRARTDGLKLRRQAVFQTLAVLSILVSLPWWRPLLRS